MAEKMYYTMGEVSEMLDVTPSLIRFWEKRFDAIAPNKNRKGNRLFTAADVQTLKTIYHLVKERGMTLAGAEKQLKARRGAIERDMELAERLGAIRALLVEVRNELGGGGVIVDDEVAGELAPAHEMAGDILPAAVVVEATVVEAAAPAPAEKPALPVAAELFPACAATDGGIVSTASASAFSASEQEFAEMSERYDDDDEYDSNPEFEPEPEPETVREPEFVWETEPEPQPEHNWEPESEDEPEKTPHPTELTLF